VLISGSGTNLQALLDACAAPDFPARVAVVISNRRDAYGLERARAAGVPAVWVPHRGKARADFDAELVAALREHGAQWVCLAGFMRIVTPVFLDAFPQRVLNIHPALLPAFPGVHAQAQALAAGVKVAGATVHFVDAGTDTGPIIAQGAVPVLDDDDEDALKARILAVEHELYPRALRQAVEGRLRVEGRRVVVLPTGG
jgi:phosphoribosylglycinamide formyltransferase-1